MPKNLAVICYHISQKEIDIETKLLTLGGNNPFTMCMYTVVILKLITKRYTAVSVEGSVVLKHEPI